jgi:hypothetical protein
MSGKWILCLDFGPNPKIYIYMQIFENLTHFCSHVFQPRDIQLVQAHWKSSCEYLVNEVCVYPTI